MPYAALRPCAYPGCANLVRSGRCDEHRQAETSYHNPDAQRLYGTARWERMRARQLAIEPWCVECLRANVWTPATDADHVVPHKGDAVKFYTGRLQSLCHVCHSRKTLAELRSAQEVRDAISS